MRAPAGWSFSDVAAGNPIQQGPIITRQNVNLIPASTPGSIGTGAFPSGLSGDDPADPGFSGKSRPKVGQS
jgi:hypothetical protein